MCCDCSSVRVISVVWLAVFLFHMRAVESQVSVTFTSFPDPPTIVEGDTAVFNCSSDHSAVLINWLLNKTISASTLTSLGVIVNGGGTPVSSLIIPGLVDPFNDTEVQCVAFGFGIGDFSPSSVILRVQGIPSEVGNLTCEQNDYDCIECNWEAPFFLIVINYVINITDIGTTKTLINGNTTAKYCPNNNGYGLYEVDVAAYNSAGLSAVMSAVVELCPKTKWIDVRIATNSTKEGHWNFTFLASTNSSFLAGDYDIIALFNDTTNATGYAVVDYQGQVSGTIETGKLDNRKWNMSISLEYGTSNTLISEPVEINTFGVRERNNTVDGFKICIEAEFIEGSNTMECLVEYKCSSDHSYGSINITRENPRGCTEDVKVNNYTVTFYDGRFNEPNKIFAIWNANVMNRSNSSVFWILETSSIIVPSSTFGSPPSTNTEKSLSIEIIIAVTASTVLAVVTVFIVVSIIVISIIVAKKKNRVQKANEDKHAEADSIGVVVYLDTEISADRPRAPPTVEEKVQYAKVESQGDALYSLAVTITENCSIVTQNILENPDNSEYSHLDSRGYKSPHQPELACNDTKKIYSTISLARGNMNKEFSYAVLSKYVAPHISHKWEELGLALALTPDDIEQFKENRQGINDVFLLWEQQQTRPFTWETLIMALESINEHELVNKL